jgi:hypothetical protein
LCDVEFGDTSATDSEPLVLFLAMNDLISVADDGQVRVVRNDERLASARSLIDSGDALGSDGGVVEVLFWLV